MDVARPGQLTSGSEDRQYTFLFTSTAIMSGLKSLRYWRDTTTQNSSSHVCPAEGRPLRPVVEEGEDKALVNKEGQSTPSL